MPRATRILLLIETSSACFRRCIQGVAAFARTQPEWILHTAEPGIDARACLKASRPDAVIARYDPSVCALLQAQKIPATFVYGEEPNCSGIDNVELGRVAARHLMNLGLRHFAFYGFDWEFLKHRLNGFNKELQSAGHSPCTVFWPHLKDHGMWPLKNPKLEEFLRTQPTPLGLFAGGDLLGFEVVQLCRNVGIQVPEKIAVLGVDNDEMLCAIAAPELSSVITPDELVGHSAAQRLHSLLSKKKLSPAPVLFPPQGVAVRRSTDVLVLKDDDLAEALAFIRQNAEKNIGVSDVLAKVGISRRLLEQKFQSVLQRSPLAEIRRVRIERAKTLLLDGNNSIAAVARATGFDSADWLSEVFRRETGMTPSQYRQRFALKNHGAV
ncbi:MAG TPA: XylR family transcriptional regulator [Planctomycetota bacterium]|nr:XylR family transcriptional regulator [Planctomycetota bacterium]